MLDRSHLFDESGGVADPLTEAISLPRDPRTGIAEISTELGLQLRAHHPSGDAHMSGSLRPSAGYIGRGVTATSTDEYMLYHQNMLAQVELGVQLARPLPYLWLLNEPIGLAPELDLARSRKHQLLPTMPCLVGVVPVRYVD